MCLTEQDLFFFLTVLLPLSSPARLGRGCSASYAKWLLLIIIEKHRWCLFIASNLPYHLKIYRAKSCVQLTLNCDEENMFLMERWYWYNSQITLITKHAVDIQKWRFLRLPKLLSRVMSHRLMFFVVILRDDWQHRKILVRLGIPHSKSSNHIEIS